MKLWFIWQNVTNGWNTYDGKFSDCMSFMPY